jgi:lysophospholipase L1-like esterase
MKIHWVVGITFGALALALHAHAASERWVQSFEASPAFYLQLVDPARVPKEFRNSLKSVTIKGTLRYRFAISAGGTRLRVRFSNEISDAPLRIGGASVALATGQMDAVPSSMWRLTFGGKNDVVVPPGAPVLSDSIPLALPPLSELVVSIYLPDGVQLSPMGRASILQVSKDAVMDPTWVGANGITGRPYVTGVEVLTRQPTHVIVALGDSITDGVRQKPGDPHGWVDALARRFGNQHRGYPTSVVSAGIGGNRILNPGMGSAALARADRDVFSVPGLSHVIVLEGINDIGMSGDSPLFGHQPSLDADSLIAGLKQIAQRAHVVGVKIYAGTILPFRGAMYFSEQKEEIRLAVNAWIRHAPEFDGEIDFAKATEDPDKGDRLNPAFDSGDHLHPSELGYKAMANAVPLDLFK